MSDPIQLITASTPIQLNTGSINDLRGSGTAKKATRWLTSTVITEMATAESADGEALEVGYDRLQHNLTPANILDDTNIGATQWDVDGQTLALKMVPPGVVQQIGLEIYHTIVNNTGSPITNGTPLAYCGYDPTALPNGAMEVCVSDPENADRSLRICTCVATHDIADGETGLGTHFGEINDIDTTHLTEGIVYVGSGGTTTSTRPEYPTAAIIVGYKGQDGATGSILVETAVDNYDPSFNGCIIERQAIYPVVSGGQVYLETELIGGGDLPVQLGGQTYLLDCTTGSGVGGRARSPALTQGTADIPVLQYVWVEISGSTVVLNAGTTKPVTGTKYANCALLSIWNDTRTTNEGPLVFRRTTDAKSHSGRGRIAWIMDCLRSFPSRWLSGIAPTVARVASGVALDQITYSNASGKAFQAHEQDFPALSIDTSGIYVLNASGSGALTPYQKVTNLAECKENTDGTAWTNGRRGTIVIVGLINYDTGTCKLGALLPVGTYGSDSDCYSDVSGYATVSVPNTVDGVAFLIGAVPLKYTTPASGTMELIGTILGKPDIIDRRGSPLGVFGSASGGQASQFSDAVFRLFNNADSSKVAAFDASGITTATTRTYTLPNGSGIIPLRNAQNDWSVAQVIAGSDPTAAAAGTVAIGGGYGYFANSIRANGNFICGDGSGAGGGGVILNRSALPYFQFQISSVTLCFLAASTANTLSVLNSTASGKGELDCGKINSLSTSAGLTDLASVITWIQANFY